MQHALDAAPARATASRWLEAGARTGLYVHAAFLSLSIAGMQLGLVVSALCLVGLALQGRRVWTRSELDLPFLALLGVVLFWPWDAPIGLRLYRTFLSPLVIASVLGLRPETMRREALRLLGIWAGFALLPGLLAWVQFAWGTDFLHALGLRREPIRPTIPLYRDRYAATGFFTWYIRLAHNLSGPLCLLAGVALYGGLERRRRVVAFVATGVVAAAVFLTFTRTAWFGLAFAALVLAAFGGRRHLLRAGVVLAVLAGLLLAFQPGFRNRVMSTLSGARNQDRVGIWQTCAEVVKDHPLTGIGYGNMPVVGQPYFDRVSPRTKPQFRAWCHNTFFTAYVEGGVFYLGAALLLWLWMGFAFLRRARATDALGRAACAGGLAALGALGVNALAHDVFYASETMYGLGFALAVAVVLSRPPAPQPSAES